MHIDTLSLPDYSTQLAIEIMNEEDALFKEQLVQLSPIDLVKRHESKIKCLVKQGTARSQMGDLKGSLSDYTTALSLAPGNEGLQHDIKILEKALGIVHVQETEPV